jgi:D-tyrosyl-tRNA(Tyr) deacylase
LRAVVQRVSEARVDIAGETAGAIGQGLLVLLGVGDGDTAADADYLIDKIIGLRIFNDADGKFNLSLEEVQGGVLVVSQFTLHGDARRGRRPSFIKSARPEVAIPLYEYTLEGFRARGIETACGRFGANMQVHLVNDGPVTILLDSEKLF